GMGDNWFIANVGVLPSHRRKGIARKVVEACVELVRERGGQSVVLDVIAGNLPAYTLYESLGFETYGGETELVYDKELTPPPCPIPDGFTVSRLDPFDWRPRYEFATRITPSIVKKYSPVTEARYRLPQIMRPILALIRVGAGSKEETFVIRKTSDQ